jgi:predicted metal-binding membrane protein
MSDQFEQTEIQEEPSKRRILPLTAGFIFAFLFVSLWNLYQIFVIQRTISTPQRFVMGFLASWLVWGILGTIGVWILYKLTSDQTGGWASLRRPSKFGFLISFLYFIYSEFVRISSGVPLPDPVTMVMGFIISWVGLGVVLTAILWVIFKIMKIRT